MSEPKTRRGPYAKTQTQQATILNTALDYFGQYGYHGASMREIARQVGISQAGLLYHFKTKADLLTAVLTQRDAMLVNYLQQIESDHPLAALTTAVARNKDQRNLVQMFTTLSAEATDPDHPANSYFRQRSKLVVDSIEAMIREAVELGQAREDIDAKSAAYLCQAMMHGLQVQWLLDPEIDMAKLFEDFICSAISSDNDQRALAG